MNLVTNQVSLAEISLILQQMCFYILRKLLKCDKLCAEKLGWTNGRLNTWWKWLSVIEAIISKRSPFLCHPTKKINSSYFFLPFRQISPHKTLLIPRYKKCCDMEFGKMPQVWKNASIFVKIVTLWLHILLEWQH